MPKTVGEFTTGAINDRGTMDHVWFVVTFGQHALTSEVIYIAAPLRDPGS